METSSASKRAYARSDISYCFTGLIATCDASSAEVNVFVSSSTDQTICLSRTFGSNDHISWAMGLSSMTVVPVAAARRSKRNTGITSDKNDNGCHESPLHICVSLFVRSFRAQCESHFCSGPEEGVVRSRFTPNGEDSADHKMQTSPSGTGIGAFRLPGCSTWHRNAWHYE